VAVEGQSARYVHLDQCGFEMLTRLALYDCGWSTPPALNPSLQDELITRLHDPIVQARSDFSNTSRSIE
jgi:hypothetical protein